MTKKPNFWADRLGFILQIITIILCFSGSSFHGEHGGIIEYFINPRFIKFISL
jgi:hypothetical protein